MIKDLYNTNILRLSSDIPRLGKLDKPDSSSTVVSKLCGSKITVYLNMEDNIINDFSHEIKACSLGRAASSVMARNIIGSVSEELLKIKNDMYNMLNNDGTPPSGKWDDLKYFEPVKNFKGRHASVLLVFDAVENCINELK
tara:strand:- start:3739 stop:4161 length:423 start_codon:yes stop_codon:yes gene_type:complete